MISVHSMATRRFLRSIGFALGGRRVGVGGENVNRHLFVPVHCRSRNAAVLDAAAPIVTRTASRIVPWQHESDDAARPTARAPTEDLADRARVDARSTHVPDRKDRPDTSRGNRLSTTTILKWWVSEGGFQLTSASPGFEMTIVTLVPDALAGVSDANRASGAARSPRTSAATADPIRTLGFRGTRSFAAPLRKLPAIDHHGVPSSKSAAASAAASSPCRDRQRAG